jgi:hypothetical protein
LTVPREAIGLIELTAEERSAFRPIRQRLVQHLSGDWPEDLTESATRDALFIRTVGGLPIRSSGTIVQICARLGHLTVVGFATSDDDPPLYSKTWR